jgi:threonine synthase
VKFRSTRDAELQRPLSGALVEGIAPDGGLYVPQSLPAMTPEMTAGPRALDQIAARLLAPFFEGDALASELPSIAREALNFPAPHRQIQEGAERLSILELFHGPTASFKDFGARFLAACLARVPRTDTRPLTIVVATSGDTGGAVAAAFHRRPGFQVALLYPSGRVSSLQAMQLTCWGDNVRSYAVRGSFDDCQRLVKQAFGDTALRRALALGSANSINVGRLLPQMTYFAAASLAIHAAEGRNASFVIPSGNLGHATACIWAREMGWPIDDIVLAHNANRTVPDYLERGEWRPRPSVTTLANAMDVGDPSNMERLRYLYVDHARMAARVRAVSVSDERIAARIRAEFRASGLVLCPHSAVAAEAYRAMGAEQRQRSHWVVAATAHPAKFPEIVEPLIGRPVEPLAALERLSGRTAAFEEIDADFASLRSRLLGAAD